MLGKLIKNGFKSNLSATFTIYITMLIMSVVLGALILFDFTSFGTNGAVAALVSKLVVSAALCVTSIVSVILTLVAVFGDFSRSMYGTEGHLTMALPVRGSALLLAKWISGTLCVIISYLVFYLSLIFCAFSVLTDLSGYINAGDAASYNVYAIAWQFITYAIEASGKIIPDESIIFTMVNLYAFEGAVRVCIFVLLVFFSITLAHVRPFNKIKKLGPILYFFASFAVVEGISKLVSAMVKVYMLIDANYAFTFTLYESEANLAWSYGLGAYPITGVYCSALMSIAVFLVTAYLIDRKVNVDA
ncbi:MAG: hypothetical protein IJC45_01275 [Clostridia bacterium]|nr:hypothetical protein [Clostridia bacterium]